MPKTQMEDLTEWLNVPINRELKRHVRFKAADKEVSMAEYVRLLIEQDMENNK